tara:strand:+ start:177 stop:356 length:180 start_codon:yes stop_codon:yes gene_type:complete
MATPSIAIIHPTKELWAYLRQGRTWTPCKTAAGSNSTQVPRMADIKEEEEELETLRQEH